MTHPLHKPALPCPASKDSAPCSGALGEWDPPTDSPHFPHHLTYSPQCLTWLCSHSHYIQTPELLPPSWLWAPSIPPNVCQKILKIKAWDSSRQLRKYTVQPRPPPLWEKEGPVYREIPRHSHPLPPQVNTGTQCVPEEKEGGGGSSWPPLSEIVSECTPPPFSAIA